MRFKAVLTTEPVGGWKVSYWTRKPGWGWKYAGEYTYQDWTIMAESLHQHCSMMVFLGYSAGIENRIGKAGNGKVDIEGERLWSDLAMMS